MLATWLWEWQRQSVCRSTTLVDTEVSQTLVIVSWSANYFHGSVKICFVCFITMRNLIFHSAATVLNSVQPQLHTNTQTMFQPVQAAVQQVTSQPTQVTNAQVTAGQMAAAQATSAATTVAQSNLSVAALQTAGLSINPAIVRMLHQG